MADFEMALKRPGLGILLLNGGAITVLQSTLSVFDSPAGFAGALALIGERLRRRGGKLERLSLRQQGMFGERYEFNQQGLRQHGRRHGEAEGRPAGTLKAAATASSRRPSGR